jgi:thiol:disulfide interchange protein DsbD
MKKFLLIMFLSIFSFAIEQEILDPQDAFKPSFTQKSDHVNVQLKLGKSIYLYDEKLKILLIQPKKVDLTSTLSFAKPVNYEEFVVHFDDVNVNVPFELLTSISPTGPYKLELQFQGCSKAGLCYAPMSETFTLNLDAATSSTTSVSEAPTQTDVPLNETDTIANTLKDGNILIVLGTFLVFGLLLSLTPCVFPMIPILSSIIVKAGDNGKLTASKGFFLSLVYVLSMSAAYTIAGVLAGLFGANLQVALQNPYVLVVFSAIFVALAFSMFGYFKLELPQSIQNRVNKTTDGKENQGVIGIAIMGFLSALIVGPCVAPPLAGALVYIGQTGDAFLGGAALFVMSLGMGAPLLLIGVGAGKFMPRPGGWMDSVSKIFGIVMLAVAIWMLDRVLEPIFVMYLWALLFIGAGLYLKVFEHIIGRLISTLILLLGIILFVGAISGATNPLTPLSQFTATKGMAIEQKALTFKYVKNLEELDAAIIASSKPVMLDFYADWCVSCKELEGITFKDAAVIEKLKGFTLLKADVTKNNADDKAMQKKFSVVGPPALIFWDSNNNEIKSSQIVGYKNPKAFLEIVNRNF